MLAYATESLLKHFDTHSLKGYGVRICRWLSVAAGAVLHYLKDTEHPNLQHITSIQRIDREDYLWMDRFTIRNLELTGTGSGEAGNTLAQSTGQYGLAHGRQAAESAGYCCH